MYIYIVIKASSGEDTNLGYNPSADVLGVYRNNKDAKELFDSLIQEERDFLDEGESITINEIGPDEVEVINEDEDYCCYYQLVSALLH